MVMGIDHMERSIPYSIEQRYDDNVSLSIVTRNVMSECGGIGRHARFRF